MIVTDTETTGLLLPSEADLKLQPFITELYAVKLDREFNIIDELDTFVKPPIPIPEEVEKITGICDAMVSDAPTFANIYDEFSDFFLGEDLLIGHNISFDAGVIWCELARLNKEVRFPWPKHWHCTVEKSFPIQNRRLKLGKLHEIATGKPHEGAHRAKADVFATVRCYHYLLEQGFVTLP